MCSETVAFQTDRAPASHDRDDTSEVEQATGSQFFEHRIRHEEIRRGDNSLRAAWPRTEAALLILSFGMSPRKYDVILQLKLKTADVRLRHESK